MAKNPCINRISIYEISREKNTLENIKNQTYLIKLRQFDDLIEENFRSDKFVKKLRVQIKYYKKTPK
jgi:hypothetical protein